MTQQYTLRAMANNYKNGHSWDHLDGEVVSKAADEIKRLEEELANALERLEISRDIVKLLRGR